MPNAYALFWAEYWVSLDGLEELLRDHSAPWEVQLSALDFLYLHCFGCSDDLTGIDEMRANLCPTCRQRGQWRRN